MRGLATPSILATAGKGSDKQILIRFVIETEASGGKAVLEPGVDLSTVGGLHPNQLHQSRKAEVVGLVGPVGILLEDLAVNVGRLVLETGKAEMEVVPQELSGFQQKLGIVLVNCLDGLGMSMLPLGKAFSTMTPRAQAFKRKWCKFGSFS